MSGRISAEEALERWRSVWRLRKQGHGQRAIARILKFRLASVQGPAVEQAMEALPAPLALTPVMSRNISRFRDRPEGCSCATTVTKPSGLTPFCRSARGCFSAPAWWADSGYQTLLIGRAAFSPG